MMRRLLLFLAAWLLCVSTAHAQGFPQGVTPPVLMFPASAINGAGKLTTTCVTYPTGSKVCENADGKITISNAAATAGFCIDATSNAVPSILASDCSGAANLSINGNVSGSGSATIGFSGRGKIASAADGKIQIQNNGATVKTTVQVTGIPTCSSNCGTSPSVVGSDTAMKVTMGGTGVPASGWVVTFNGTWAAAPVCAVQMALAGMANTKLPLTAVTTTTTLTVVTNGAAPANSDVYFVLCLGVQ